MVGFSDEVLSLKLMEMGLVPGEKVRVIRFAPLGDPMAIEISGYQLALRLDEADKIHVERFSEDRS